MLSIWSLSIGTQVRPPKRGGDSFRVSDVKMIQTALELYYLDQGEYPDGSITEIEGMCLGSNGFEESCSGKIYVSIIPFAHTPADGNCTDKDNSYSYKRLSPHGYTLTYCLGKSTSDVPEGVNIATEEHIF
ncbi:type II secretion system protein GspG, partial [Patescibacteria group bacterium AH-259-L07]|nr:type II secretion system protein GspG [Patescibacteria group bacterium AH-259-L07]